MPEATLLLEVIECETNVLDSRDSPEPFLQTDQGAYERVEVFLPIESPQSHANPEFPTKIDYSLGDAKLDLLQICLRSD
jgi:hypothetical protein